MILTLQDVYNALEEKGYNPINQIVGYLLSGDPAYIPRHNDARNLILKHERDEIIEELVKSYLVHISDIDTIDDDTLMLTINGGSNNVVVDLNKEHQFFNQFNVGGDKTMDKEMFVEALKDPKFKEQLLGMDLNAKITEGDVEKASIWNGYVETLEREMKEQITKKTKAYYATIIS